MKNKDMKNKDFEIVDGVLKKYHGSDECVGVPYRVRKIGDEAFKGAASLKKLIMPETVEGIGDLAFEGCMHLESAVIVEYKKSFFERLSGKFKKKEEYNHLPYSARTVGVRAFADCVSLLNVDLPVGVNRLCKEAFCGCMNLPMIVLPSSVEEIEEKVFFTCKNLKNVKLSSDIARIGGSAFADTALQEIDIPDSIRYVVQGAFPENIRFTGVSYEDILAGNALVDEEIKRKENKKAAEEEKRRKELERKPVERRGLWIPSYNDEQEKKILSEEDSTEAKYGFAIEGNVLKKYTGMGKYIKIPDSIYEIGESAFCECATLKRVVFPDNLKSIGSKAFYNCVNLSEIVLPHSVESIDKFAFSRCHSIEKLEIKAEKIKIEARAFANCLTLKEISISANFADIGELAFFMCNDLKSVNITCIYKMNVGYGAFSECEKLKDVYLSGGLTDISDLLFSKCKSLTNVKIPYSVCNIGARAFEECASLKNIKLPEGVHTIGNMAFNGCELLSKIYMPAKIKNMGYDVFKGCVRLKNLTVNGKPVDTGREIVTPITKRKTETVTKVKSDTVSKTQNKTQTPTEVRYHRYIPENKETTHNDVDKAVNTYSNRSIDEKLSSSVKRENASAKQSKPEKKKITAKVRRYRKEFLAQVERISTGNLIVSQYGDNLMPGLFKGEEYTGASYEEGSGKAVLRVEVMGTGYEGRTPRIERLSAGDRVEIVREPENEYNSNNLAVRNTNGESLGNLAAEIGNCLSPLIDDGAATVKKAKVSLVKTMADKGPRAKKADLYVEFEVKLQKLDFGDGGCIVLLLGGDQVNVWAQKLTVLHCDIPLKDAKLLFEVENRLHGQYEEADPDDDLSYVGLEGLEKEIIDARKKRISNMINGKDYSAPADDGSEEDRYIQNFMLQLAEQDYKRYGVLEEYEEELRSYNMGPRDYDDEDADEDADEMWRECWSVNIADFFREHAIDSRTYYWLDRTRVSTDVYDREATGFYHWYDVMELYESENDIPFDLSDEDIACIFGFNKFVDFADLSYGC